MKHTMAVTILGLMTGFAAHARIQTVSLQCLKTSGMYPAKMIVVESAVTESGKLLQVKDDPEGYRLEFSPVAEGQAILRASRNYAGNYYYSEFTCTETKTVQAQSK